MFCKYTLTGFGQFLEWRTVRFTQPLPKIRICRLCGVVASAVRLLPCTHVLCESCEDQVIDRGRQCPIDGSPFVGEEVQTLPFAQRDLGEREVHCLNDTGDVAGCTYTGKLADLEDHFIGECAYGQTRCPKCRSRVVRKDTVDHYLGCKGPREAGSSEDESDDGIIFDTEEAVSLATALREIREGLKEAILKSPTADATMVELQHKANTLASFLRTLDPKRHSASKVSLSSHGSWYDSATGSKALCKFEGVDAMRKAEDPTLRLKQPYFLEGYTFDLSCQFERHWGKLSGVSFLFTLLVGAKDDFVQWPFTRQVSLTIVHPKKEGNDLRVPIRLCAEKDVESLRRPDPGCPQKGVASERVSWKEIDKNQLVFDNCLFVAVEFE